jgi:hypothetical protein
MTSPNPGRPAGGGDRDAEIIALLLGELRAATAAARARGATDEQVRRLIEQRREALRRSHPGPVADPGDRCGSDAVAEDAEHRGDDPPGLRGIA